MILVIYHQQGHYRSVNQSSPATHLVSILCGNDRYLRSRPAALRHTAAAAATATSNVFPMLSSFDHDLRSCSPISKASQKNPNNQSPISPSLDKYVKRKKGKREEKKHG
jgi:hypothetical protein